MAKQNGKQNGSKKNGSLQKAKAAPKEKKNLLRLDNVICCWDRDRADDSPLEILGKVGRLTKAQCTGCFGTVYFTGEELPHFWVRFTKVTPEQEKKLASIV